MKGLQCPFGALFAGTEHGFRWGWLSALHSHCDVGGGESPVDGCFTAVDAGSSGRPYALRLNADETTLVLASDRAPPSLAFFDVRTLLGGRCSRPLAA